MVSLYLIYPEWAFFSTVWQRKTIFFSVSS